MTSSMKDQLSKHDEAILNNIFNHAEPLTTPSETCYHHPTPQTDNPGENQLEQSGIQLAENGKLEEAVKLFTHAINLNPDVPSLYNNRAQVYRLLEDDAAALADLEKVIELTNQGEVYCKALCQRGILYFKNRRDTDAIQDFQKAAGLGSEFAKEQMVKLNPYATLCNATLKKVFETLK